MPCTACGADCPPDGLFCVRCGRSLGPEVEIRHAAPPPTPTDRGNSPANPLTRIARRCAGCGQSVADGAGFCSRCGQALAGPGAVPDGTQVSGGGFQPPPSALGPAPAALPPAPTGDLGPGTTLWGRYVIEALLGEGGMGQVYAARDLALGASAPGADTLAVKLLPPSLIGLPEARRRLEIEVAAARSLDHENVLRVFELRDEGGVVGIVMERLNGATLHAHLSGMVPGSPFAAPHPGRLDAVVPVLEQLAAALDYIHARGFVHRDVKPSNVMLCPMAAAPGRSAHHRLKLLDFGVVRAVHGSGFTGVFQPGTPAFMAPEIQQGTHEPTAASDLYAFGKIAYQVVTGHSPTHQTPDPSTLVPQLNRDVDTTLMAYLHPNPAFRPPLAFALIEILHRREQGRHPVQPMAPPPPAPGAPSPQPGVQTTPVVSSEVPVPGTDGGPASTTPPYTAAQVAKRNLILPGWGFHTMGQPIWVSALFLIGAIYCWCFLMGWLVHVFAALLGHHMATVELVRLEKVAAKSEPPPSG